VLLEWLASGQVDAAVLPSDGEGLPVFLIEALANYVPAIGADAGGVAELLGDGCGEVVPLDDAGALADAISRVLRTPDLRERMVRAGRTRVEREFAIESVVRRLRELLGFAEDAEEALTADQSKRNLST
jgi:glycosyltransferase involved in cell wall biosynthesis